MADRLRMDAKNRKISILGFKMMPAEQNSGQQGFKNLPILERKKSHRIISPSSKSTRRQRTDTSVDSALIFSDANEKARSLYEEQIALTEKQFETDRNRKRKLSAKRLNAQLSARASINRAKNSVFANFSGFNTQRNQSVKILDRQQNYFLSKNLRAPPQISQ